MCVAMDRVAIVAEKAGTMDEEGVGSEGSLLPSTFQGRCYGARCVGGRHPRAHTHLVMPVSAA